MGAGGKIFDDLGNPITSQEAIRRSRLGLRNTFVGDPFPKSNRGDLAVVTGGSVRVPLTGTFDRGPRGRARPQMHRSRTPESDNIFRGPLPDFSIDNTIKKGTSFFPSQTPSRSLSSISIGDPSIGRKKRSKLSKKDKAKKKKKAEAKPIKSIFDLSF